MKAPRLFRCLNIASLILAGVMGWITFWPISPVREIAQRSVDSSNLRQIGQASLIYASDHRDKLPVAENSWDYAGELARDGGLNDAAIWVMENDPANKLAAGRLGTVLGVNRRELNPAFRTLVLAWAVPLGGLSDYMPETMPIAWTRGLRPDGTWAPHSPNGTEGGHIVFLGGNVAFYRDVRDELQRYDGKGTTSNILDALPPGTRIGEYVPNEREQAQWMRNRRVAKVQDLAEEFAIPALWLVMLATLGVQVFRKLWPPWLLIWFLVLSFIAAIVTPTVS